MISPAVFRNRRAIIPRKFCLVYYIMALFVMIAFVSQEMSEVLVQKADGKI